jgi:2-methylcitrate dehydratase PrpD
MTNPWHVGKSARNGVVAARMAADGFVAHPGALEAKYGFLNLFQGEGEYDSDAIVNSLGNPWDLLEPGPVVKVYPCCGLIHTGLDAILELQAEEEIDLDAIEEVVVSLHEYVPGVMFIDVPETGYQAKFSVPYTVALALLDRRVGVDSFETVRPEVVELGRKVRMAVHPDLHGGETFWEKEFTEVDVVSRSGTRTKRISRLDNRGIGRNLSDDDLRTKLAENLRHADPSTPGTRAEQDWERLVNADSAEPWRYW